MWRWLTIIAIAIYLAVLTYCGATLFDYRPDVDPRIDRSGRILLTDVTEMVPTVKGYRSAYAQANDSSASFTPSSGESGIGSAFGFYYGGVASVSYEPARLIMSTNKRLLEYDNSATLSGGGTQSFRDVSRASGGSYTNTTSRFLPSEEGGGYFDFCAYGDVILAFNAGSETQRMDLNVAVLQKFQANGHSLPWAATCCVAQNFVFAGNLSVYPATSAPRPDEIAWSAIGDWTSWTPSASTQAGNAVFYDTPGNVTVVRPLRDGVLVFKGNAFYFGHYVGAGTNSPIWDFQLISDKIGCVGPRSIANIHDAVVFASHDDVYLYDGARAVSITDGVRDTLLAGALGASSYRAPRLTYHPIRKEIWLWGGARGSQSYIYVWNTILNRWGRMTVSAADGLVTFVQSNINDFMQMQTFSLYNGDGTETDAAEVSTTVAGHQDIFSKYFVTTASGGTVAKKRSGTRSTTGSLTTGLWGQPNDLLTLKRVNPILTIAPATVANLTVTPYGGISPASMTAGTAVAMNSNHRCDMLGSNMTKNFHSLKIACTEDFEIIDVAPLLESQGAK